jgi:hypothetical protein
MIVYEVSAAVESALSAQFEMYMTSEHIPDLMATGCFMSAMFSRSGNMFQIRYTAVDRAMLDRYLAEHAERLRADVVKRFPSGIKFMREIWDVVAEFPSK